MRSWHQLDVEGKMGVFPSTITIEKERSMLFITSVRREERVWKQFQSCNSFRLRHPLWDIAKLNQSPSPRWAELVLISTFTDPTRPVRPGIVLFSQNQTQLVKRKLLVYMSRPQKICLTQPHSIIAFKSSISLWLFRSNIKQIKTSSTTGWTISDETQNIFHYS